MINLIRIVLSVAIYLLSYNNFLRASEKNFQETGFNDVPKDVIQHFAKNYLPFEDMKSLWLVNKQFYSNLKILIHSIINKSEIEMLELFENQREGTCKNKVISAKDRASLYYHLSVAVKNCTLPEAVKKMVSINFTQDEIGCMYNFICMHNRIHLLSAFLRTINLSENDFYSLIDSALCHQRIELLKIVEKQNPEVISKYLDSYYPVFYANNLNIVKFLHEAYGPSSKRIVHQACSMIELKGSKDVILYLAQVQASLFELVDSNGETPEDILHRLLLGYIKGNKIESSKKLSRFLFKLKTVLNKNKRSIE